MNEFYNRVVLEISRLLFPDFRPLPEPRLGYENPVAVDMNRVDMGMSLALGSGLNPGKIVRSLGGEYDEAWSDVRGIFKTMEPMFQPGRLPTFQENANQRLPFQVDA